MKKLFNMKHKPLKLINIQYKVILQQESDASKEGDNKTALLEILIVRHMIWSDSPAYQSYYFIWSPLLPIIVLGKEANIKVAQTRVK